MELLQVKDLDSGYDEVQILRGATLSLEKGQMTSLVGANGAGKTTLLKTVMGIVKPWAGVVSFLGQDISRLPAHRRAELGLVLVPEGRQLFTDMTVLENLELGATNRRARPHFKKNLEHVCEAFPRVKERLAQKAGTLSGGEQQMVAVARGIMAEPEVLMIDELSLGLAPVIVIQLFETLKTLRKSGLTILVVEQNVHMALAVSNHAYVLAEGRVYMQGNSRELMHDPHIREAYLGL